jgi:hypothetical protein
MIKEYCDICGEEITKDNANAFERCSGKICTGIQKKDKYLEIQTSIKGGEICKYCLYSIFRPD